MKQQFLVGSRAFFKGIDGFRSKDKDILVFIDKQKGFKYRKEQSLRGICTFYYKQEPARTMIERVVESGSPIQLGKFLVPEVAQAIGATLEDILLLEPLVVKLDPLHTYQADIFYAYKENGSFTLTDEQLAKAYETYCKSRKTSLQSQSKEVEYGTNR